MLRVLPVILVIALTVYALIDLLQTPDDEVEHLPKIGWLALIILLPIVGGLVWVLAGRSASQSTPARERPARPTYRVPSRQRPSKPPEPPPPTVVDRLDPSDPEDRWLMEQRDKQRATRAEQEAPPENRVDPPTPTPDA